MEIKSDMIKICSYQLTVLWLLHCRPLQSKKNKTTPLAHKLSSISQAVWEMTINSIWPDIKELLLALVLAFLLSAACCTQFYLHQKKIRILFIIIIRDNTIPEGFDLNSHHSFCLAAEVWFLHPLRPFLLPQQQRPRLIGLSNKRLNCKNRPQASTTCDKETNFSLCVSH